MNIYNVYKHLLFFLSRLLPKPGLFQKSVTVLMPQTTVLLLQLRTYLISLNLSYTGRKSKIINLICCMISVNAASIVILFSLKSLDYVLDILVEPLLLLKVYQKAKDETFYHGRGISKLLK